MSGIGKTSNGYRKAEFAESRSIARTQKTLRFAHEAAVGETSINLQSLTTPSVMSVNGFVNPNSTDLIAAELLTHKNNLKLKSSLRGPMEEHLDYVVASNTTIRFLDPFIATSGEIFTGVLEGILKTGTLITDAKQFAVTDILAVGATDISLGFPIPVTGTSGSQIPSVAVFRNGRLQVQNVGNSSVATGNYWLVPGTGGISSVLRFNLAGVLLSDNSNESVVVFPIGLLPFMATDGMTAALETIAGQIDLMIPDLATVTGNPTANYQSAPNNVDLRQFATQVMGHETRITTLETRGTDLVNMAQIINPAYFLRGSTVGSYGSMALTGGSGAVPATLFNRSGYALNGSVVATDNWFGVNSLPAGSYLVKMTFLGATVGANSYGTYRLKDSVGSIANYAGMNCATSQDTRFTSVEGVFTYGASGNRYWYLDAKIFSGSNIDIYPGNDWPITFSLYRLY